MTPATRLTAMIGILIMVIACLKLVYFERWLVDNDNYAILGTFFSASQYPDYPKSARLLYEASVASCDPQDKRCIAYSGAIHAQQTYARPLFAFFGSFLAQPKWLTSSAQFLQGVTKANVWQLVASTALVVALLLCFLMSLPQTVSTFMAGMMALLGAIAYVLPEQAAFGKFQPLLGVNISNAFLALIVALATWLYARAVIDRSDVIPKSFSSERLIQVFWASALLLLAVRVAATYSPTLYFGGQLPGSGVGLFVVCLSLAGLAIFLAAMAAAGIREGISAAAIWISVLLLLGFVAGGQTFFTTAFRIAPRASVYLLAVPIMIYVALRPNGRALWLIPALALFHVSVAGLLCGCILVTEIVAGLRRKSVSLALVLSAAVLIAAGAYTLTTSGNLVIPVDASALASMLSRVNLLAFLPGLAVLAVLLCAGYAAWRMPDPAGDFFLRAVVLAASLAGAGQIRVALESAGYDLMDPVAYNFVLLSYYLAPMICGAGAFLVILGFATSAPSFNAREFALSTKTLSLVAAGVLALVAARGSNSASRPPNALIAFAQGVNLFVAQGVPASIDPRVMEAASPNDHYLIGPTPGDAITMTSILKMKARSEAGLLDPANVHVIAVKRGPS